MALITLRPESLTLEERISATFDFHKTVRVVTESSIRDVSRLLAAGATDSVLDKLYATELPDNVDGGYLALGCCIAL